MEIKDIKWLIEVKAQIKKYIQKFVLKRTLLFKGDCTVIENMEYSKIYVTVRT